MRIRLIQTCVWCLAALNLGASDLRLDFLVGGLSSPLYLTHAGDGSGRSFIVEQGGRIRIYDGRQLLETPFLDIRSRVRSGGETGLLGLAFHPNFESNRRFFVNYTRSSQGSLETVIAEYQASDNDPNLASSNERVLLTFGQPDLNHNGGWIGFGPDGHLYIASGDGGRSGDFFENAQNTNTLLGAILRIDVDSGNPYGIPPDNPFVGQDGADEIYAYGLRNPWRASFDRATGRLLAADVGQDRFEEVDIIVRGGNYGWNIVEGNSCFSPANGCDMTGLIPPIDVYGRRDGVSVTGGYVYRGPETTEHQGDYVFGDFGSGNIWTLRGISPGNWQRTFQLSTDSFSIASFGEDEAGNLYLVSLGGAVFSLHFGTPPPEADLSVAKVVQLAGVEVGELVTYSITVRNAGPDTAQTVMLEDQLPQILDFGEVTSSQGTCSPSGNQISCDLGDLAAAGIIQITLTARVLDAGQITNTTTVSTVTNDSNLTNNSDTAVFEAQVPATDLRIFKSVDNPNPVQDSLIVFRLEVQNQGLADALDVEIRDTLPVGLELEAVTSDKLSCSSVSNTVTCTLEVLAVDQSATVNITTRVPQAGAFRNQATVSFGGEEVSPEDNISGADIMVLAASDLVIEKKLQSGLFPGKKAEYQIRLTNQGQVASAAPITVTDDLHAPLSFFGGGGPDWTCEADGSMVTCTRETPLQAAESSEIEIQVLVGEGLGEVANTAFVVVAGDFDESNNSSTAVEPLLSLDDLPLTFSQLALGGGFELIVLASNRSSNAWHGAAQLREGNDEPWTGPWTLDSIDQIDSAEFPVALGPHETGRFVLKGDDTARSGYLRFVPAPGSSSLDLIVSFFYQLFSERVLIDSTATSASLPGRVFQFPAEKLGRASNTGMAWAPLESITPFPIELSLYDSAGELVEKQSINFEGHEDLFFDEVFQALPEEFLGLLVLESPTLIHLTVLRVDNGGTIQLTSVTPRIEPH